LYVGVSAQKNRLIRSVRDEEGNIQTSQSGIAATFLRFLRTKYENIAAHQESTRTLASYINRSDSMAIGQVYETFFTHSEILTALNSGGQNRAPGRDGLGLEFYKVTCKVIKYDLCTILNEMFFDGTLTTQQKQGIIMCIPKQTKMTTPEDRRPITLLNTGYKLVTRMIAQRLKPILEKNLSKTQFCGDLGNNILDAVATVRDTIAFAEYTNTPLCVMALDFKQAFDNISHEYLFSIICSYGLTERFANWICDLYRDATSTVQINGRLHGTIPIKCGVRQGCPLSMALYTLCLQPFLDMFARRLTGIKIGREKEPVSVVAYADDVTLSLTSDTDRQVIEEAIQLF
jgi:hypothetical protein